MFDVPGSTATYQNATLLNRLEAALASGLPNLLPQHVSHRTVYAKDSQTVSLTFDLKVLIPAGRRRLSNQSTITSIVATSLSVNTSTIAVGNAVIVHIDCNGVVGGNATVDDCGVCGGVVNNSCADCAGVLSPPTGAWCSSTSNPSTFVADANKVNRIWTCPTNTILRFATTGPNRNDKCGVCDAITSNDCVQNCAGVYLLLPGSTDNLIDACGVCNGTNTTCAGCDGVPNSNATIDRCGLCNADPADDCQKDCTGMYRNASTRRVLDACSVCGGDNSTCTDCAGVPNGNASVDRCNVCDADPSNDCVKDCAGRYSLPPGATDPLIDA
eukprot:COSAG01_NODE_8048_length_2940_cov_193.142555_2_plen_327_part_01